MAKDGKTQKIERDFPLTNSMVNEYGFRLLTSGYVMEEFLKNPIGYRMHNREDGVICRWEDLRIDGDTVYGKPVINLANPKGEQTVSEVENGFLSHASVGQIVLIEYVVEPHPERPDESIVTGTKWYHKEASLVDAPGNRGLLPVLCDADEREIKIADLTSNFQNQHTMKQVTLSMTPALIGVLGLADGSNPDVSAVIAAISDLSAKAQDATLQITQLKNELSTAQTALQNLQDASGEEGIMAMLAEAKLAGKVNDKTVEKLAVQYKGRPEELKELLADMQPFGSVLPHLQGGGDGKVPKEFEGKTWGDLHKANKIKDLKDKAPDLYKQLYKAEYGREPKM